jgi:hypothetical protein
VIGDSTVVLIDGAEYELRATELLDEGFVTGVPKNKDTARIFLTNYRIDQIQLDEA